MFQYPPQTSLAGLDCCSHMRLFSVCGLPVTREHGSFHSLVSCREKAQNLSHGEKKGTEEV